MTDGMFMEMMAVVGMASERHRPGAGYGVPVDDRFQE